MVNPIKFQRKKFEREKIINQHLAQPGPWPVVLVLDHLKSNFNIGKIFRMAEVFGVREIHLIGVDFFNPYPAKGAFKKVKAHFWNDFDSCHKQLTLNEYTWYLFDPKAETSLFEVKFQKKSALLLGHEEFGITSKLPEVNSYSVKIPQWGKTQSLNVAQAAGIAVYEYLRQQTI